MNKQKFNIGDTVFIADYGKHEKWVTCPDCFGTKTVKVILGNGDEITIECCGCTSGYEPAMGVIRQFDWSVEATKHTVTGVNQTLTETTYYLDKSPTGGSYRTGTDDTVFATRDEAVEYGNIAKEAHERDENKRWMAKTKDHKSWRWNASYHRGCITDLERQLAYHRSKYSFCAAKDKSECEVT